MQLLASETTSSTRKASIFVSYCHQDIEFTDHLVKDMRRALGAKTVWYDKGPHSGVEWWQPIVTQITERGIFLAILSPDALLSRWVREEMAFARNQYVEMGKFIVPICYRPCILPVEMQDWRLFDWRDFTNSLDYTKNKRNLLKDLRIIRRTLGAGDS